MCIVLLTTVLPSERRTGGEVVTQGVVEALRTVDADVRVLGYRRPGARTPAAPGEQPVGTRPIETAAAGGRAIAWMAQATARRMPYSSAKYWSRAYRRAAREALTSGPAAVVVDHAQVHFAAEAAGRSHTPPLVFIAHNVERDVYAGLAKPGSGRRSRWANSREAKLIGRVEIDLAARARQVWALTPEDAGYFQERCPGADVRTLAVASQIEAPAATPEPACDVALIGSWSWSSNARGLEWFAREVIPLLPGVSVRVAGTGAEWLRGRYPDVEVCGVVTDAAEFMRDARVVAVPSVAGGGVQVKTLDAVASGVPVVATAPAARGLEGLPASVAVTDEPGDFADALRGFLADPGRDRMRSTSLEWSRTRRARFEASVASWIGELAA